MGKQQQRPRRFFTAEFKIEAVRLMRERKAAGLPLSQISRELDLRPDMLREWARELAAQPAGAPPAAAFPGQGRLTPDAEELRRLQRDNARLQQEVEFLKKAAAYFAQGSR